jgi:hypothetical protein
MIADLRPALRAFLLADAAISTAVGGTRIYPTVLKQGIRDPSIVYNRITGLGNWTTTGPSGLTRPRFQIDCYATTSDQAEALADLVKARLDGYRGLMGSVMVQGVFFDTERDDYQADAELYRTSRDYFIWFEERN